LAQLSPSLLSIEIDDVKKCHKFCETLEDDKWRVVKEIDDIGQSAFELEKNLLTKEELNDIPVYLL
jgi:hypothetical protein